MTDANIGELAMTSKATGQSTGTIAVRRTPAGGVVIHARRIGIETHIALSGAAARQLAVLFQRAVEPAEACIEGGGAP